MDREDNQAPTILVVDDFEDMRFTLRIWLEKLGYKVIEAVDGEQAVELTQRERPSIILMDIGMPQRSGISAAYKIRKDPELREIPIVAITAYDTLNLHEDAMKAGCVECLTKPVDTEHLEKLLDRLLS
jgi:two-component system cell cycle response regulator DivK